MSDPIIDITIRVFHFDLEAKVDRSSISGNGRVGKGDRCDEGAFFLGLTATLKSRAEGSVLFDTTANVTFAVSSIEVAADVMTNSAFAIKGANDVSVKVQESKMMSKSGAASKTGAVVGVLEGALEGALEGVLLVEAAYLQKS